MLEMKCIYKEYHWNHSPHITSHQIARFVSFVSFSIPCVPYVDLRIYTERRGVSSTSLKGTDDLLALIRHKFARKGLRRGVEMNEKINIPANSRHSPKCTSCHPHTPDYPPN